MGFLMTGPEETYGAVGMEKKGYSIRFFLVFTLVVLLSCGGFG